MVTLTRLVVSDMETEITRYVFKRPSNSTPELIYQLAQALALGGEVVLEFTRVAYGGDTFNVSVNGSPFCASVQRDND